MLTIGHATNCKPQSMQDEAFNGSLPCICFFDQLYVPPGTHTDYLMSPSSSCALLSAPGGGDNDMVVELSLHGIIDEWSNVVPRYWLASWDHVDVQIRMGVAMGNMGHPQEVSHISLTFWHLNSPTQWHARSPGIGSTAAEVGTQNRVQLKSPTKEEPPTWPSHAAKTPGVAPLAVAFWPMAAPTIVTKSTYLPHDDGINGMSDTHMMRA